MTDLQLYNKAKEVRENAYAPYSKIQVGAALLTKDGRVFCGVNVENSSFGATVCAERSAVCAAVSAGEREFEAIAVSGTMALETPCGICRQFLSEFSPNIRVIYTKNGVPISKKLSELLPESFEM